MRENKVMTIIELLDEVATIENEGKHGSEISAYFSDSNSKIDYYSQEYSNFVKIMRYVFEDNRNCKRKTILSLTQDDIHYCVNYKEYSDITHDMREDLCCCTFLYCYVLQLYANGLQSECPSIENDVLTIFKSINRNRPIYCSNSNRDPKKRKSHSSKRDLLHSLVLKIKENPKSSIETLICQDLIEIINNSSIQVLSTVVTDFQNSLEKRSNLFAYRENLKNIQTEYNCLCQTYQKILQQIDENCFVLQYDSNYIFTQPHEIELIIFLYQLYVKYKNTVDLRSKENHRKWDLLESKDKNKLFFNLQQLDNSLETYFKYIACDDNEEARISFLSLLDSIDSSLNDSAEDQLYYMLRLLIQSDRYDMDYTHEQWEKMIKNIKKAYTQGMEIKKTIHNREKAFPSFHQQLENALKKE